MDDGDLTALSILQVILSQAGNKDKWVICMKHPFEHISVPREDSDPGPLVHQSRVPTTVPCRSLFVSLEKQ